MVPYSPPPPRPVLEEYWAACDAGNADRVRELFQTSAIKPEHAQFCLDTTYDEENISIDILRVLLDNGASATHIYAPSLKDTHSIDVYRFLAENGLDFKKGGHELLE
jgi:hypothetical protein